MLIKFRTAAVLAMATMTATLANAASVTDDLIQRTWRDYEVVYVQDGRPMNETASFIHSTKAKKLEELDKQCKAKVKAVLEQESPAQAGDDKTLTDRKQRIARGYLTCMLIEMKEVPTLSQVAIVVSSRRNHAELDPFRPGEKTTLTN